MTNTVPPAESPENGEICRNCQHSVDVRGMTQIVCLAFLSLRDPLKEIDCPEFECKRKRPLAGPVAGTAPIAPPSGD